LALAGTRRGGRGADPGAGSWPGFVDALSTLLLVFIFLLVIFVISQVVLSFAISGKDEALDRLNRQVAELSDLLDLERRANAELRLNVTQLSSSLQGAVATRDELAAEIEELRGRADEMERRALSAESALAEAGDRAIVDKETLELRLKEIVSLRRDLAALKQARDELEKQVTQMAAALQAAQDQNVDLTRARAELETNLQDALARLTAERDRTKALSAELSDTQERTALKQQELEDREVKLAELTALYAKLETSYEETEELSATRKAQVASLSQQIDALREELRKLSGLLEIAERENESNQAQIADLGARLNRALVNKVEELSRYRSEFFGRLRQLMADKQNVQIVGDRFVFQSEVLFDTGSAELGDAGRAQLAQLAELLLDIAAQIPTDINWVLRIDGHTDIRPIYSARYPSNWELSSARAISVAKYLIDQGVPPARLAPTGFAEFQPLDNRSDEIAYRRNRRIEMKLTTR
jgi:chemotaxis protein MotB